MQTIIVFMAGAFVGAMLMGTIAGSNILNQEREIYMQGYLAGQTEAMKEKKKKEDI